MATDLGRDEQDLNTITVYTLRLLRGVRNLPADLGAVAAFVVITNAVIVLPVIRDTPLRILVGLPFVLFIPGYAFIAALFPESSPAEDTDEQDHATAEKRDNAITEQGIDGIERVALSFGLSIALVPLIGLVLNFTPWGIRLAPILVSLSGFVLLVTGVAAIRRYELPPEERFKIPYRDWAAAGRREFLEPDSRTDAALNVLLVLSVFLAAGSVGFAVFVPNQGESFTELYLLAENGDGELVADGYPTNFTSGESKNLTLGVSNQEHEPTNYTLVGELQRVQIRNNSTVVQQSESVGRFDFRLEHNETWRQQHTISPTLEGHRLRLIYLLYRGSPPEAPTADTAYREVHLWVNVTAQSG